MDSVKKDHQPPQNLLARRQILEWRDRHKNSANMTLTRRWQDLKPQVAELLEGISWYQASVSPSDFIVKEIDPILVSGIADSVGRIISDAEADLLAIVEQQLERVMPLGGVGRDNSSLHDLTDIFTSIAPLAGGLALGAAIPSIAVVSGTVAFGLVAVSTVSMPILVSGLAVAGGAIATGVVKTSNLRLIRSKRMMKRVQDHVDHAVFSLVPPSTDARPKSVLLQIHEAIEGAAHKAQMQFK